MHYISIHSAAEFAKFVTRKQKNVELDELRNVVKTYQLGFLFSTVTPKRGTFKGNETQVYYLVVEMVVIKLHIFTKATVQFYSFSFSYKVTYLDFFVRHCKCTWNFINRQVLNELQKALYSLQNFC